MCLYERILFRLRQECHRTRDQLNRINDPRERERALHPYPPPRGSGNPYGNPHGNVYGNAGAGGGSGGGGGWSSTHGGRLPFEWSPACSPRLPQNMLTERSRLLCPDCVKAVAAAEEEAAAAMAAMEAEAAMAAADRRRWRY
ncbi:MAG: hypothetical protein M1826_004903 [Phylliscum demangeonii]|nr:MAG: hypothetical protein M1826_004903 [Phylliscum demangeonii]